MRNTTVKQPENIDDPPMEDTASEDEHQHPPFEQVHVALSDDDVLLGNIQRTTFKPKSSSNPATAPSAANRRCSAATEKHSTGLAAKTSMRRSARQTGPKKRIMEDFEDDEADEHDFFASKKTRIYSDELAGEVGAHMSSEKVFSATTAIQRGYGKRSHASTPQAKLQVKRYNSVSTSPEKQPTFKSQALPSLDSSPVAQLNLSLPFKIEDGKSSPLPKAPSSEIISDPPRVADSRIRKQKAVRRPGKKDKNNKKAGELSPEPVSQKPQFKIPDGYNNYAPSTELVDLSSLSNDPPEAKKRQLDPGKALCPMCDEQVDEILLKEFSNGERMKLVRQVKFCRMHKKVTAQKTWKEKGYPIVDWAGLEARIEAHHDLLKNIIMGSESHFGDLLQRNIRTGQARTLLTTDEYLTPGYYGLRGMSVMTELVTDKFSNLLRERAPVDTRISGRGYTRFVQAVLVPELAVKLIQEDLSLGEDEARETMKESRLVGEILNDEKRQSQSQSHVQGHDKNQGKEKEYVDEENSDRGDADATLELKIEQAADSVSDLSSPLSYSQSPMSVKAQPQEADDSDSDESFSSLKGSRKKKVPVSLTKQNTKKRKKTQNVTNLPTRPSPTSRDIKDQAHIAMEIDDSDDLSSLHSL